LDQDTGKFTEAQNIANNKALEVAQANLKAYQEGSKKLDEFSESISIRTGGKAGGKGATAMSRKADGDSSMYSMKFQDTKNKEGIKEGEKLWQDLSKGEAKEKVGKDLGARYAKKRMMADKFYNQTGYEIGNVSQDQINSNFTGGRGSPVPVSAGGGAVAMAGGGAVYNNQNNSKNTYNINVTSTAQDGVKLATELSDAMAKVKK
jgi:hypothetical protein